MKSLNKLPFDLAKAVAVVLAAWYLIYCVQTPDDFHFIYGANLIIHEAGHTIFVFFGQFLHVLGGSFMQVAIPELFAGYFFLRRDMLSGGIILMWMGESLVEVARYAADAIVMQLPLLGGNDNVIHDWNWLLSDMHLLAYTPAISGAMRAIGIMILISGIVIAFAGSLKKKRE